MMMNSVGHTVSDFSSLAFVIPPHIKKRDGGVEKGHFTYFLLDYASQHAGSSDVSEG